MSLQRKRPYAVQCAIATLTINAIERGDEDAAAAFARQAGKLADRRKEHERELRRGRADAFRSVGMMRNRNGSWE